MTAKCRSVGCERRPKDLFGLVRKPPWLFGHCRRIRSKKRESVEGIVEYEIILFSRLSVVNGLSRLVKVLQGNGEIGEIGVPGDPIRCKPQGLLRDVHSLLILPLLCVHDA